MDTFWFSVVFFAYHLALALIVGGGLVLGSAVAPALFRTLPSRADAGLAFGAVLARYDGLAILAVLVVLVSTWVRAANYETPDLPHWIRWGALVVMSAAVVYASAWSNPVARALRAQTRGFDELPERAPVRQEFARAHARSRRAMNLGVLAGLVALFLS